MKKRTNTIIGVISVSLISSFIYDYIKDIAIFTSIWTFIKWIWYSVLRFSFTIEVWVILLVILALLLLLFIIGNISKDKPLYDEYTNDVLKGYLYKWSWAQDRYYNVVISNLQILCNDCGTPLKRNNNNIIGISANCVRCGRSYNNIPKYEDIEILIIDNYNKKLEKKNNKN